MQNVLEDLDGLGGKTEVFMEEIACGLIYGVRPLSILAAKHMRTNDTRFFESGSCSASCCFNWRYNMLAINSFLCCNER